MIQIKDLPVLLRQRGTPSREEGQVYSSDGYRARAEECVRLANLATDALVQADLLKLRQTYLQIAERLRHLSVTEKPRQLS